jgi:hypothetical protein
MPKIIRLLIAVLCFGPPLLVATGVGIDFIAPGNTRNWALQGLFQAWWGRLLLSAAWLGLAWLCYRSVFNRRGAA